MEKGCPRYNRHGRTTVYSLSLCLSNKTTSQRQWFLTKNLQNIIFTFFWQKNIFANSKSPLFPLLERAPALNSSSPPSGA